MNKEELRVSAIKDGTVIDHIPSNKLLAVVSLLHLENVSSPVTVGYNLKSRKMGKKSLIKIADRYFTDEEINQLSVVSPNVTLCIIKNYDVVEKKQVKMPDDLSGIVRCHNPKCITNNEPMRTLFHVVDKEKGIIKCHYCEKEQSLEKAKLV
ncbi:MAG TPA: aspartate carbamoyltransferase regulatory subunit [Prevotellaceae bacterium]|nr:aspartate carbamoyltransferase regulatory subunit [Prevotellaceae bacterium]